MTVSRALALFAVLALATAGRPASASAATPDTVEASVATADLDLTTESGLKTLHKRIHRAARTVCGHANPAANPLSDGMLACEQEAISQTRDAIRSAVRLAAVNQAVSLQASAIPR